MYWEVIKEIIGVLGGVSAILIGLFAFYGKSLLIRIASKYNENVLKELEKVKAEMILNQKSYESQLPFIVDYYTLFYKQYRRCQQYANFEIIKHPDLGEVCTKNLFECELDSFKTSWDEIEPRVRLILPKKAYQLHCEVTESFNLFTQESKKLSGNSHEKKKNLRDVFKNIHEIKETLELLLREHLRA
ncbi:hypothetical protein [Shewanella halifaxensis]|uniref:hypothetical protein n=1 Tax=Shewanella halifaxensis TaxID=271098 RepID=UPI0013A629C6|nr:hypothetical protein [Shewanella halifaxensis]